MIADLFPQLHTALFLLLTHDEHRPVGYPDPDYKPENPYERDHHFYSCPARLRDVPCQCSEDSYREMLAKTKIELHSTSSHEPIGTIEV
jgi:hypothetical protein